MNTKAERVIAERSGRGWLVMWPDGNVVWLPTKAAVLKEAGRRIGKADVLITELEWRP